MFSRGGGSLSQGYDSSRDVFGNDRVGKAAPVHRGGSDILAEASSPGITHIYKRPDPDHGKKDFQLRGSEWTRYDVRAGHGVVRSPCKATSKAGGRFSVAELQENPRLNGKGSSDVSVHTQQSSGKTSKDSQIFEGQTIPVRTDYSGARRNNGFMQVQANSPNKGHTFSPPRVDSGDSGSPAKRHPRFKKLGLASEGPYAHGAAAEQGRFAHQSRSGFAVKINNSPEGPPVRHHCKRTDLSVEANFPKITHVYKKGGVPNENEPAPRFSKKYMCERSYQSKSDHPQVNKPKVSQDFDGHLKSHSSAYMAHGGSRNMVQKAAEPAESARSNGVRAAGSSATPTDRSLRTEATTKMNGAANGGNSSRLSTERSRVTTERSRMSTERSRMSTGWSSNPSAQPTAGRSSGVETNERINLFGGDFNEPASGVSSSRASSRHQ